MYTVYAFLLICCFLLTKSQYFLSLLIQTYPTSDHAKVTDIDKKMLQTRCAGEQEKSYLHLLFMLIYNFVRSFHITVALL